jgi:hypothetical protein
MEATASAPVRKLRLISWEHGSLFIPPECVAGGGGGNSKSQRLAIHELVLRDLLATVATKMALQQQVAARTQP